MLGGGLWNLNPKGSIWLYFGLFSGIRSLNIKSDIEHKCVLLSLDLKINQERLFMVSKILVQIPQLRTIQCIHCHETLIEEAYSQWSGFDTIEGENLSQDELIKMRQDMQTENIAWQAEADKAWEASTGEFLLAHSSCGLPLMPPEVKKEAEELHTQQTPPEVKVTEEKQTTQ